MAHNLGQCLKLLSKAAEAGAEVIFFPEASDYIASSPQESLSLAKPESESPFVQGLQAAAKQHNVHVNVGIHVPVQARDSPQSSTTQPAIAPTTTKLLNRSIWILPTGDIDPSRNYDKLHLFDYGNLRESAHTQAGAALTPPFDTPVGRVGSLICFDLRFPEAATALAHPGAGSRWAGQPAQVLTYPSAFTVPTGRAHWEVLLRARAVEAQCWVVAAAQAGWHAGGEKGGGEGTGEGRVSYGGSLVIDPWGEVKCSLPAAEVRKDGAGGEEEVVVVPEGAVGALGLVEIDSARWEGVRERMPLVRRT
ncbi:hypothetical protein VPNG_01234 [Cytospora leucostoma]|uniref:CN hydrolase domain-containing protein n=1 Tax=Cytospora leucostoma TaxID=1230097 RepID=A0A423XKY1_9PEZI|nr:hypothetical protein VPNG_01234 [Cytospora leucostoma]